MESRSESKTHIFCNIVSFVQPNLINLLNSQIFYYAWKCQEWANFIYEVIKNGYGDPTMKVTMKISGFTILNELLIL